MYLIVGVTNQEEMRKIVEEIATKEGQLVNEESGAQFLIRGTRDHHVCKCYIAQDAARHMVARKLPGSILHIAPIAVHGSLPGVSEDYVEL